MREIPDDFQPPIEILQLDVPKSMFAVVIRKNLPFKPKRQRFVVIFVRSYAIFQPVLFVCVTDKEDKEEL